MTHEAALQALACRLPQMAPHVERIPIGSNIPVLATDAPAARAALRARYGWPSDTPVIAYFGFLHPVKGLETLLQAFHQVIEGRPAARLLLSGGTQSLALYGDRAEHYQRKLEGQIHDLGLAEAVRLTGYLPDEIISQHLAGADIGVLPFNEGVSDKSGSLLAMWAHGLPVIATRPPISSPQLEWAAWLVPPRNAEALAASLLRLLDDPSTRQALADRARQVAGSLSWPAIAERHLALYQRLVENQ